MTREKGLRVLFVTNYRDALSENPVHGIFAERQARSLREAGVEVTFFDLGRRHSPLALLKRYRALRLEIRAIAPDLLHAQQGTVVSLVAALAFRPVVITFTGSDLLGGASVPLLRGYLGILISNLTALLAKRMICVSPGLRDALWWRRKNAVVIPHGVDTVAFSPGSREEARAAIGWDVGKPIVMIGAGRDPRNKGLDIAEEAVSLARLEMPELELYVSKGIQPERMPLYFRAADALICSSRNEGSPNVVKEALACALPVIGVPVGDVAERLAGVEPSAVVQRNPEAIAKAILQIVPTRRRSNGVNAVADLALPRIAARVIEVYEQALGKSRKAGAAPERSFLPP
jgi:teichuronic acid biosynthesis glycosyltransferase TuaC